MTEKRTIEQDLFALASLEDSEIDTSDIPETTEFVGAQRGKYFPLTKRAYDIRAIANWCINRATMEGRKVRTLWLNKIVYFIYEKGIQEFDTLLSDARLEAWKHGPVFREIFFDEKVEKDASLFKKYDKRTRKMEIANEEFSSSDLQIFESVWKELGHKSGTQLRELSHEAGGPWDLVWSRSEGGNLGLEIDIATIMGRKARGHGR